MADGIHTARVIAYDNLGNSNIIEWTITMDKTKPTISSPICGTITSPDPEVSFAYEDAYGVNPTTVAMKLDGNPVTSAASATYAVYTASGLSDGVHTAYVSLKDNAGNSASKSCTFTVDADPPQITTVIPADGAWVNDQNAMIHVYWADAGAGVDQYTGHIELDGADMSAAAAVYPEKMKLQTSGLSLGVHTVSASVRDKTGKLSGTKTWSFRYAVPNNYYFTWYDNVGALNWVLMGNPVGGTEDLNFGLSIANKSQSLAPWALQGAGCPGGVCGAGQVPSGMAITPIFSGLRGGPVKVASQTGQKAIVSQRSLWKGGNSLEEIPGMEEEELSSHFYWTWYDNKSPGWLNWVLVSNPEGVNASADVYYQISIGGRTPAQAETVDGAPSGVLKAGQSTTPRFPNLRSGPVEVQAWKADSTGHPILTQPADVMASQRVLSNFGTPQEAFNEVPGIPEDKLSDDYLWTWYDNVDAYNWVLVSNPSGLNTGKDVYYEITVDGQVPTAGQIVEGSPAGTIKSGSNVTPRFRVKGGPVEVRAWADAGRTAPAKVIASQRSIWGPSFEEVPGFRADTLSSDYHWSWYDQKDPGTYNWVLVNNPESAASAVYYEIRLGGNVPAPGIRVEGSPTGVLAPGQSVTPRFDARSGPVEVLAWRADASGNPVKAEPAKVMASQRVIWHGYFNEVLGTLLE